MGGPEVRAGPQWTGEPGWLPDSDPCRWRCRCGPLWGRRASTTFRPARARIRAFAIVGDPGRPPQAGQRRLPEPDPTPSRAHTTTPGRNQRSRPTPHLGCHTCARLSPSPPPPRPGQTSVSCYMWPDLAFVSASGNQGRISGPELPIRLCTAVAGRRPPAACHPRADAASLVKCGGAGQRRTAP